LPILLAVCLGACAATEDAREPEVFASVPLVDRDLDRILEDTLRVLVLPDPLSHEWRPNAETGVEYELLARFAKAQGVTMVAVQVEHPDSMRAMLQTGRGDVVAACLATKGPWAQVAAMTSPYGAVAPMIASLREGMAAEAEGAQDTVVVPGGWSPFGHKGYRFARKHLRQRELVRDSTALPEDLLAGLLLGHHAALIVPDALAEREAALFPPLQFEGPVGPPVPLSFAVRSNSKELHVTLDAWLQAPAEREARELLLDAGRKTIRAPGPFRPRVGAAITGDSISAYDEVFQRHAGGCGLPWELLAAMAWKESRFNPDVRSARGAFGIMQMMPRTATRMGLDHDGDVDDQVAAAARYLCYLDTLWRRAVPDRSERLHFVLASYNSGPGHVIDAQRLAEQLGADPGRWEGHVERTILLKAKPRFFLREGLRNGYVNGAQTFLFVRGVMAQYTRFVRHAAQVEKSRSSSAEASSGGP
jgi:membrane-bound lytic murein transglycosylase F